MHFGSLLSKELGLHAPHMLSCFHAMMIEERWAHLLALILAEEKINSMQKSLEWNDRVNTVILLEQAIPCILHLKTKCRGKYCICCSQ